MLSNLKQALLQREYETLSEELDEMILLGEDEDLFTDDELGLTEGAKYDEHDFDDIPEDDISLGDDDLDVLLDEEQDCKKCEEEEIDAELTEEMEMDILEFTEFDCVDEEVYTEDTEHDFFSESEEVEEDFDFEEDEEEDEDFGLEECVDYIYFTESEDEEEVEEFEEDEDQNLEESVDYDFFTESTEEEDEETEEVEEELSESVFFADFMEM